MRGRRCDDALCGAAASKGMDTEFANTALGYVDGGGKVGSPDGASSLPGRQAAQFWRAPLKPKRAHAGRCGDYLAARPASLLNYGCNRRAGVRRVKSLALSIILVLAILLRMPAAVGADV